MNVLTKIASRNIWRSKKRSFIIITAVSIGLWAGIFMIAFYNGMIEERINNAITTELSHIQLPLKISISTTMLIIIRNDLICLGTPIRNDL